MSDKVLMVDDDKSTLSAYRRLLHNKITLVTAESGIEAITALKNEGPFAVVVSDYRMPGMNGIELLAEARRIAPDTIRIILSGLTDMQIAIDVINEGHIYRFLTKPCSSESFINAIKAGIEQYRLVTVERELNEKKRHLERLQMSVDSIIKISTTIIEKRDPYTAGHQSRVAEIASAIAMEMQLSDEQVDIIKIAAAIHDIGKISVPTEILSKPGPITDAEYNLIKNHVQVSYDILNTVEFPWPIAEIVYQHHEKMDGSGYPLGIVGDEIRLEARIIAVADVIEAMAWDRPYRQAFTIEETLNEIRQKKGILFDVIVVDACLKLFERKKITKSCFAASNSYKMS